MISSIGAIINVTIPILKLNHKVIYWNCRQAKKPLKSIRYLIGLIMFNLEQLWEESAEQEKWGKKSQRKLQTKEETA